MKRRAVMRSSTGDYGALVLVQAMLNLDIEPISTVVRDRPAYMGHQAWFVFGKTNKEYAEDDFNDLMKQLDAEYLRLFDAKT